MIVNDCSSPVAQEEEIVARTGRNQCNLTPEDPKMLTDKQVNKQHGYHIHAMKLAFEQSRTHVRVPPART